MNSEWILHIGNVPLNYVAYLPAHHLCSHKVWRAHTTCVPRGSHWGMFFWEEQHTLAPCTVHSLCGGGYCQKWLLLSFFIIINLCSGSVWLCFTALGCSLSCFYSCIVFVSIAQSNAYYYLYNTNPRSRCVAGAGANTLGCRPSVVVVHGAHVGWNEIWFLFLFSAPIAWNGVIRIRVLILQRIWNTCVIITMGGNMKDASCASSKWMSM